MMNKTMALACSFIMAANMLTGAGRTEQTEMNKYDSCAVRSGTNQADAILVPINTRVRGSVEKGAFSWMEFTTPSEMEGPCTIVAVNRSANRSIEMRTSLFDQFGNNSLLYVGGGDQLKAGYHGDAASCTVEDLQPDTTYYLKVWGRDNDPLDYMINVILPVSDPSENASTTETLSDAYNEVTDDEDSTNTNLDDAHRIEVNELYRGTVADSTGCWFAFTTGENPDVEYSLSITNRSPNSHKLVGIVSDEAGNKLLDIKNGAVGLMADRDGTTQSAAIIGLKPCTTYYVGLWAKDSGEDLDYAFCVNGLDMDLEAVDDSLPEADENQLPVAENQPPVVENQPTVTEKQDSVKQKEKKAKLVLEKPLELTNNQVMFKGGCAEFVNKSDVIAVLKPLARIMKGHPDHSFLLVGTTATAETEEYCLQLSNERATAVKNVLVNELGVSESQIKSVGRGFAKEPFSRGQDRDAEGNFIESEGAKNRRVIVLDLEDPIAKGLLQ